MVSIQDIKKMIARGETSTLEVKKTTGELRKGMESACAFLNSDGGWLLFGIAPDMRIVGQSVSDATRQEIAKELRKIEPAVDVEAEYVELEENREHTSLRSSLMRPISRTGHIPTMAGHTTRWRTPRHPCHASCTRSG